MKILKYLTLTIGFILYFSNKIIYAYDVNLSLGNICEYVGKIQTDDIGSLVRQVDRLDSAIRSDSYVVPSDVGSGFSTFSATVMDIEEKTIIDENHSDLKIVGFAAETDLSDEVLLKKFNSKPVELLVGTKVNNGMSDNSKTLGFNVNQAIYRFTENGTVSAEHSLSKRELAEIIFQRINL